MCSSTQVFNYLRAAPTLKRERSEAEIKEGPYAGKYYKYTSLGSGQFGITHLFKSSDDKKIVVKERITSFCYEADYHREAMLWQRLERSSGIAYDPEIKDENPKFLWLEFFEGSQLRELVPVKSEIDAAYSELFYFVEILKAVQNLHQHQIVHLDLHSKNILIDQKKEDDSVTVKSNIVDLGASQIAGQTVKLHVYPEEFQAHPSQDIYHLGTLLQEKFSALWRTPFCFLITKIFKLMRERNPLDRINIDNALHFFEQVLKNYSYWMKLNDENFLEYLPEILKLFPVHEQLDYLLYEVHEITFFRIPVDDWKKIFKATPQDKHDRLAEIVIKKIWIYFNSDLRLGAFTNILAVADKFSEFPKIFYPLLFDINNAYRIYLERKIQSACCCTGKKQKKLQASNALAKFGEFAKQPEFKFDLKDFKTQHQRVISSGNLGKIVNRFQ